MSELIPTDADNAIRECLSSKQSFALIAGAGSGKTTSLIDALKEIRAQSGDSLRKNGQRIACVTYTKRAVDVIKSRLGFDELYHVSTLHSFLWGEIGRFHKDIGDALRSDRIPNLLTKAHEKDNGGNSKEARKAREKVARFQIALTAVDSVREFKYTDAAYSDYENGILSHDDIIEVAGFLLQKHENLRKLLGVRYPYIFVDEAQDTFKCIVEGLNLTCGQDKNLPLVGYFGDPWQQIYEGRAGDFSPPPDGRKITKTENFRCSMAVIDFLNAFRRDVQQEPAGSNKSVKGSVQLCLVQAENPEGERKKYSQPQIERALQKMDQALEEWGWSQRNDVIRLFLVRQMIARRLGFSTLNQLFTGQFASARAQEDYETGDHYLLKPFLQVIHPLITAYKESNSRVVIDILRKNSPDFDVNGGNATRILKEMIDLSRQHIQELSGLWDSATIKQVLFFCRDNGLIYVSDRLEEQLFRDAETEPYDDERDSENKGNWLADQFFSMKTAELGSYCNFMQKNTAYSTQHGVKGEEYPNVLVVFDDTEAAWNNYNFLKLLAPQTSGDPTEGQRERGRKLAYVCFSRAEENLRILLFTPSPNEVKSELMRADLLKDEQISIITA